MIIICFVCVLLVVSVLAVCSCLGQQDFVGFVLSLAAAPAHVKPKARCSGRFVGAAVKYYYIVSEDSAES